MASGEYLPPNKEKKKTQVKYIHKKRSESTKRACSY
jgi:hypothetical protein